MQSKIENNVIMAKFEMGEDVIDCLKTIVDQYKILSGVVEWGIGRIRDLEVGYFDGKEYRKKTIDTPLEILSFHGSIASDEPRFHIHVAGAGEDHLSKGGHLFSGVVEPLLEVQIRKFDDIKLQRRLSEKSNLKELDIPK